MATRNGALKARIHRLEQRAGSTPQVWEIDYIGNWREHAAGTPPVVMARRIIIIGSDEESAALPDAFENPTAETRRTWEAQPASLGDSRTADQNRN